MTQTRVSGTRRPAPLAPARPVTFTGRGGVVALSGACFLSLLVAAWTGWSAFADVIFIMACVLAACYTRPAGLRALVVSPPPAFAVGTVLAQVIAAPDGFSAAEGILVTLGSSAPWLFTGTGLTFAIALGRGYRPRPPGRLLGALRDRRRRGGEPPIRPGDRGPAG